MFSKTRILVLYTLLLSLLHGVTARISRDGYSTTDPGTTSYPSTSVPGSGAIKKLDPLTLDLSVLDKVLFSVYVVHAAFTFFQLSSGHRELRDEKVHRLPYVLSFISICLHLGTYIMRAIYVARGPYHQTAATRFPAVIGLPYTIVRSLSLRVAHLTLIGAVLVMVYQRMEIFARKQQASPLFPTWKKVLDGLLFLITKGFIVATAAAQAIPRTIKSVQLVANLQRGCTVFLTLCVLDLWISAFFLRTRMSRVNFHDGYIRHIVLFITPLIFLQSLNMIIYDIVWSPIFVDRFGIPTINRDAYNLAYTIILGLSSVPSIHMFQALYRQAPPSEQAWPLKEMDKEKWRE